MNFQALEMTGIWQPSAQGTSGPLMVVLHGRGDSAEGFEWLKDALALPQMSYLLLNAPDEYYTGYSWYDLPPNQLPGIERSRQKLQKVFTEVLEQGYLCEQIFLFGFSQGCLMTLEFGGRFEKRLAGYIGISGYCFDPQALLEEASSEARSGDWLVTHGKQDDVLPVERTRSQINYLVAGGFPIDYQEFTKSHTIDDHLELRLIRDWLSHRVNEFEV